MLIKLLIIFAVVIAAVYFLYINGMATFSNKKALIFLGKNSFSKKSCSATFKACTGYIKRVMISKNLHSCTFDFDCKLDNGEVKAILKGPDKKEIFTLTPEHPQETVELDSGKYYLTFEFYKAYGSYTLTWK